MAKISNNPQKVKDFPSGTPFIQLPTELLASDAWRKMPINCRKLLDRLLIEHSNHAGCENGFLKVTYDQLEDFGINRSYVNQSTEEAERRGLICVNRRGRKSYNKSYENYYTLTFFKIKNVDKNGEVFYTEPTSDWKRYKIKSDCQKTHSDGAKRHT